MKSALIAAKYSPIGTRKIGGVQSWSETIGHELEALGYRVEFWDSTCTHAPGIHDIGIFANGRHTRHLFGNVGRSIYFAHGIIDEESPYPGCDVYAAVSEEVRDYWGMDCPVIRQPIDLDYWQPSHAERRGLVRYSYRSGLEDAPIAAMLLGTTYRHRKNLHKSQARRIMRGSACILASGRSALEAMACGAPVVICDSRTTYMKPMMDCNTEYQMTRSYSGRGGVEPTPERIAAAARCAVSHGSMRYHVEAHHDSKIIMREILEAIGC